MRKRVFLQLAFVLLLAHIMARSTLAAPGLQSPPFNSGDWTILAVGLTYLLPVGLILLSAAAFSEEKAVSGATGGLVAWGLATLAYFGVGFAFQYGGIAVFLDDPDLAGLYWEYSLLDTSWGTGWGMIGLKGFLLLREASTPGALTLFLSHLPLLGTATLIPYFALHSRSRRWIVLFLSLLMGGLIYPLAGNWTWASGWLANLGRNLAQGHGLIDAGGSGQVALIGAAAALAALLVFRKEPTRAADELQTMDASPEGSNEVGLGARGPRPEEPEAVPMPPAHLPVLGLLGAILMVIGWLGTAFLTHLPGAMDVQPVPIAVNLVLSALGGTLSAGLYSWFTTSQLNPLMGARGLAAGLVVAAAGAPFIPPWSALGAGLVVGIMLPLIIYFFDRVLPLYDKASALATFGVPALLGLLLPAMAADGRYGVGWNGVGAEDFQGVVGQGVSGLLVSPGYAADWPGQMIAQLVGGLVALTWSFGLSWLLVRSLAGLISAWERTGLEIGAPPEAAARDEEEPHGQERAPSQTRP